MGANDRSVRVYREEIERLLSLKSEVDYRQELADFAENYRTLGWALLALDAQDVHDLEVDFSQKPETWKEQWQDLSLEAPRINLGVCTGRASRLMVLEVNKGQGESLLDQFGEWRAACVAALGSGREQHFYAWHQSPGFEAVPGWKTPDFQWFGEGQVALIPPSADPEGMESWRWLRPPWENRPQPPSPSLGKFLQEYVTRQPQARPGVSLSWQEVYCLVSPYESLLQAMISSPTSMELYYQGILLAAREVGLRQPEILLPLLWHAPHGDARENARRWESLMNLVATAPDRSGTEPRPVKVPFDLILDNARQILQGPVGDCVAVADTFGPGCSPQRGSWGPPEPGAAPRQSLSSRVPKNESRKV
ncbi:MAG: bifunctional DNA primase/polymerase [Desulfobaccales bacterium]